MRKKLLHYFLENPCIIIQFTTPVLTKISVFLLVAVRVIAGLFETNYCGHCMPVDEATTSKSLNITE
jgi:hypothetical protein